MSQLTIHKINRQTSALDLLDKNEPDDVYSLKKNNDSGESMWSFRTAFHNSNFLFLNNVQFLSLKAVDIFKAALTNDHPRLAPLHIRDAGTLTVPCNEAESSTWFYDVDAKQENNGNWHMKAMAFAFYSHIQIPMPLPAAYFMHNSEVQESNVSADAFPNISLSGTKDAENMLITLMRLLHFVKSAATVHSWIMPGCYKTHQGVQYLNETVIPIQIKGSPSTLKPTSQQYDSLPSTLTLSLPHLFVQFSAHHSKPATFDSIDSNLNRPKRV